MEQKDLAGSKLLILFFVDTLNVPLTNIQITEFFIKKYLMSYFELQPLLAELIESKHLEYTECRSSHYYTITEKGKEALDFFRSRIDANTRSMVIAYADENRARIRRESQLTADYNRISNNEYEVLLRVMECDLTLLELKLNVINAEQARTICDSWTAKAPEVYRKIMESLI